MNADNSNRLTNSSPLDVAPTQIFAGCKQFWPTLDKSKPKTSM